MAKPQTPSAIADLAVKELGVKPRRALQIAQLYQTAVYKEIVRSYYLMATMEQIRNNTIPFSITTLRRVLGRYGRGADNNYWWDWLHTRFPLVDVRKTGNSIKGVNSMVEPTIPIDIILASGNGKDLVEALYSSVDAECELHFAPINTYSLENYVLATTALYSDDDTIKRNLRDARLILAVARECDSRLPQIVNHSSFGRIYYRGLNLQNVHRTVRHAALGAGYSVDINSSVFNWKYAMTPFNQELTYTRELIQDKTRIRKHLAQRVFGNTRERSIKTIKEVLTAISFGAKETSNSWWRDAQTGAWTQGSISKIILSPALREQLFKDAWMQNFMAEQKRINDYIGTELAESARAGEIPHKYLEDLRSERGRISKSKLIAWAYQQSEQQVMRKILNWSRAEVTLQVHDGVYFKTKPDMGSMQTVLQEEWPLATLSIEAIDNYHYRNRELDLEHLEHIRQEELKANNGVDPRTTGIHTEQLAVKQYDCHSEPDWESEQMREYYEHFPEPDPNMPEFARRRLQ